MEPRPTKGITGRPRAVIAIVTVLFAVMILKLWSLQIVSANKYREMGRKNTIRRIVVKPERGIIFDKNGLPLATNRIRFDASADYGELIGSKRNQKALIDTLSKVLSISEDDVIKELNPRHVIAYMNTKVKKKYNTR